MFSLFKKNKFIPQIPEWASFFNNENYTEFIRVVEEYFNKKNIDYSFGDGVLTVDTNELGFNSLGLVNVAQVCHQDEKRNYKNIVKEHFDSLARAHDFDLAFKKKINDYNQVKEYIGVRLYSVEYFAQIDKDAIVGKLIMEDIYATLIFDFPDSIKSIKKEEANNWEKSLDELFETGIQNIREKYPFEITRQEIGDFTIWFIQADHFFTPNIVFNFHKYPELLGTNGSIIGIPHRHAVIIYPIETIEVVNAITSLIPIVTGMYHEGPGSVSANLFWYKDGLFENLPYEIEDDKFQFYPPETFLKLLNNLS